MTDEEKAINYTNNTHIQYNEILSRPEVVDEIRKAYLAGLEACKDMVEADLATIAYMQGAEQYKLKWHKVADGDLPTEDLRQRTRGYYLTTSKYKWHKWFIFDVAYFTGVIFIKGGAILDSVVAWREIVPPNENKKETDLNPDYFSGGW